MRLISIFKFESRAIPNFQILRRIFHFSLFLEQLISANVARNSFILSRMKSISGQNESREEQINSSEFGIGTRVMQEFPN